MENLPNAANMDIKTYIKNLHSDINTCVSKNVELENKNNRLVTENEKLQALIEDMENKDQPRYRVVDTAELRIVNSLDRKSHDLVQDIIEMLMKVNIHIIESDPSFIPNDLTIEIFNMILKHTKVVNRNNHEEFKKITDIIKIKNLIRDVCLDQSMVSVDKKITLNEKLNILEELEK